MLSTQQVDGRYFEETQAIFGGKSSYRHITLENLRSEALAAGFDVMAAEEWRGEARFTDVATLVRYLAYVPWEVPDDFSVDRYAPELLDLHNSARDLTFTQRRLASAPCIQAEHTRPVSKLVTRGKRHD